MANTLKKCLKIGLLNARSLNTGSDELLASFSNYQPDILAVNETWLREDEAALAPSVPNYRFVHKARSGNRRGGGVGFYIRKGITARVKRLPQSELEQLWIEVQLPGAAMAIGTAYRPESVSVHATLNSLSETVNLMGHCTYVCLLGDLNINIFNGELSQTKDLMSFCYQHNLHQLVREPTRVTESSETLIDIVLTDAPSKCQGIDVIHNTELSDHAMVLLNLNIEKPKFTKIVKYMRFLRDIDRESFLCDLRSFPWHTINNLNDVDQMIETFNKNVITLFDMHAPIKKSIIKDLPRPWITDNVKFMMKLREKALLKARASKTDTSRSYYRSFKNFVTATRHREKKAFFNHSINKNINKPDLLWKNLKNTTLINNSPKVSIQDYLNNPDKINLHFLDLPPYNNNDIQNIKISNNIGLRQQFELKLTSEEEVRKIINNIKTKAMGSDALSIDMIILTLDVTLSTITQIINKSISTHTFPTSWKSALVTPIPKKNTVTDLNDLRPISILPVLSKVLEKVVLNQVTEYIDSYNLVPKYQSGFRKGHGTESALLHITDDLTEATDIGHTSILVLLDYSKAFDCVLPDLLLSKLEHNGFSTNTCRWFQSFLLNREQRVVTEGIDGQKKYSAALPVQRGVPQGSLLSPTLFSIFTADLPSHIHNCKYHLYADDTQVYYSFPGKDVNEAVNKINSDLNNIYNWSKWNGLKINPSKTQMVIIGTKLKREIVLNCENKIKVNNTGIEVVEKVRNLGLIIDGEQKFVQHINNKIKTAFFKLKTLYKIRPYINAELRHHLTESLVLSHFNYCSSTYGPRLNQNMEYAIQRVQNACIRYSFNIPRREFITPYLNKKSLLNMKARRELQYACTIKKIIYSKKPEYLFEKLNWRQGVRNSNKHLLAIPVHRTAHFRGCFRMLSASIWNDLPPPLRERMSADTFKFKYKTALLKRQLAGEDLKHSCMKDLKLKKYF